jgi:hypothetical protein
MLSFGSADLAEDARRFEESYRLQNHPEAEDAYDTHNHGGLGVGSDLVFSQSFCRIAKETTDRLIGISGVERMPAIAAL